MLDKIFNEKVFVRVMGTIMILISFGFMLLIYRVVFGV